LICSLAIASLADPLMSFRTPQRAGNAGERVKLVAIGGLGQQQDHDIDRLIVDASKSIA
jgi:hypothetical protein